MSRSSAVWCLGVGLCFVLAGCRDDRSGDLGVGDGGQQQASQDGPDDSAGSLTGRPKGLRNAERDRTQGIFKLKEYPPLPYSLNEIRYIRLLKQQCGVEHEVLNGKGKDRELRAEAEAYNSVMTAAIKKQYGADVLVRLRQEAAKR